MKWSAHNGCTSVAVGQKILNFMTSFRYVFQTLYFCKYYIILQQKNETDQNTERKKMLFT